MSTYATVSVNRDAYWGDADCIWGENLHGEEGWYNYDLVDGSLAVETPQEIADQGLQIIRLKSNDVILVQSIDVTYNINA